MKEEVTFKDLKISEPVLKVLNEMGFIKPSEIQEKAIPALLNTKCDFVGQAQTGTGKTAAFVIPLLERIDPKNPNVQALILAPTRELANQVENEIKKMGKYTDIKSTCVYGGTGYETQIRALKKDRPQIVVGTPGRVIDMIKKRILNLDEANFCILDEADEMLNMGFFDDVQIILESFQASRQLVMFSATMPAPIVNLIKRTFKDPIVVKIDKKSLSNDDIEQKYFCVRDKHFKEALARLIDDAEDVYAIVFCGTKVETKVVADDLKKRGYLVDVLNGDLAQADRDHAMNKFKSKEVKILVCTDVAARGIDVDNLTHVFNYGLPRDNESYVHRIGRTGRAGTKGKAYTIVGPRSVFAISKIERHINNRIESAKLPTVESLKVNLVSKEIDSAAMIFDAIKAKGDDFKTEKTFELMTEKFGDLDREELLKLMFVWKFNKEMRHLNNLADIESDFSEKKTSRRPSNNRFGNRRGPRSNSGGAGRGEGRSESRGDGRGPSRGPNRGGSRDGGNRGNRRFSKDGNR